MLRSESISTLEQEVAAGRNMERAGMYVMVGSTPGMDMGRILHSLETMGCSIASDDRLERWRNVLAGEIALDAINKEANDGTCIVPIEVHRSDLALEQVLRAHVNVRALLLHDRPEASLLKAMMAGESPKAELERWHISANRMMDLFRRNRRQVVLISVEAAAANRTAFADICCKQFGIEGGNEAFELDAIAEDYDPLHQLLAAQMVAQDEQVMETINELDASSLPLGRPVSPVTVDCESIYMSLPFGRQREEAESRPVRPQVEVESRKELEAAVADRTRAIEENATKLEEENEHLLLLLHQVQDELETRHVQLEKAIESRNQIEGSVSERSQMLRNNMIELEARKEQLILQVRQLQAELESQKRQSREELERLEQQKKLAVEQNERLKKEVVELNEDKETLKKQAVDFAEDNELLQLQLHQIQEELESYYLQLRELAEKQGELQVTLVEREATIRKKDRNLAHHEKRCKALELENAKLERELARREQMLAAVRNSSSWKITRPIRALKLIFARKPRGQSV